MPAGCNKPGVKHQNIPICSISQKMNRVSLLKRYPVLYFMILKKVSGFHSQLANLQRKLQDTKWHESMLFHYNGDRLMA